MKIKTQQYFGAFVSVLAITLIVATLVKSIEQTDEANFRSDFATTGIADGIAGLRLVAVEYIVNHSERAKQQWQQRYASLTGLLAKDIFKGAEEQSILNQIRLRHAFLQEAFSALIELDGLGGVSDQKLTLSREVERRLVTQIMIMTQTSVADATRLAQITHGRIIEAQRRTNWLVVSLVVMIGVVIATNFASALTQILLPIRKLTQGAEAFASGDFNFRTGLTVHNELGALSQAFDQMAARLADTVTALEYKTALLEETNKELESFSYSVSHDLRSPLRGIDGWGLALVEDYGGQLDATAHDYVDRIRYETQRMGRLIDDLLQLARVTRTEIRHDRVDLSALADSIVERLKQSQASRQIDYIIAPGLTVQGDFHLLEIALTNLLDNACKFTSPRSAARIEFGSTVAEDPATKMRGSAYFVRDNGVGFDMAHAQKLFGAFQRMHGTTQFPGTGIGLATVQRIVHRHGGKVWAEARLDQGATFYFTLPQASPLPMQALPENGTKEPS